MASVRVCSKIYVTYKRGEGGWQNLTLAEIGGRGIWQILTLSHIGGGGVWKNANIADKHATKNAFG